MNARKLSYISGVMSELNGCQLEGTLTVQIWNNLVSERIMIEIIEAYQIHKNLLMFKNSGHF